MKKEKQKTALLLIDIQKGFEEEAYFGRNRNNKNAEKNASLILAKWRSLNLPVFHIVHSSIHSNSPLHESKPGFEIKDEVQPLPNEPVIVKKVHSAFIGTNLQEQLDAQNIKKVVIVGLTTNHCVSTSTRMAGNLGYTTILVADATATFDRKGVNGEIFSAEIIHQTALASLNEEFAKVLDTKTLLKYY